MELIQGDCLVQMSNLSSNSIDLVVTSPPYDNLRDYDGAIVGWSFEKFKAIAKELFRIVKWGGSSLGCRRRNYKGERNG